MSKRLRLALSSLCAVVAVATFALYASHVRAEVERERSKTLRRYGGDVVTLVVATRTLEAGESVSFSDVEQAEWISTLAPEGALMSLDDVVGREVSVPVAANAPLCELNFRDGEQLVDIPSGHVAVSVPITEKLGIASTVAAGSHVVAYRVADGATELVGQDAIVLNVPGAASQAMGRTTLTIAVRAKDVSAVLEASAAGDLRLVVPAEDVRSSGVVSGRVSRVEPDNGAGKTDAESQDNTEEGA